MLKNAYVLALPLLLAGCSSSLPNPNGHGDSNGCRASNGYVWSSVRKACVVPSREGVKLHAISTRLPADSYLLVDASKRNAEILTPYAMPIHLKERRRRNNASIWQNAKYRLLENDFSYELHAMNGEIIYRGYKGQEEQFKADPSLNQPLFFNRDDLDEEAQAESNANQQQPVAP